MAAVVVSGLQDNGRERIAELVGQQPTTLAKSDPAGDIARLYAEIGKLRSESRLMALEREALGAKLAALARGDEPVTTASIPRTPEPVAGVPPIAANRPAMARRQVYPPVPSDEATDELASIESFEPSAPSEPVAGEPPPEMDELASLASPEARSADTPLTATSFALEIGAAATVDELRGLWRDLSADHPSVLGDLEPTVVGSTDGGSGYRLLAGPLANVADAMNACVGLASRDVDCLPAVHQGETLTMR